MVGVLFGYEFLARRVYQFRGFAIVQPPASLLGCFANWDGVWYSDIADHGYTYDSRQGSNVIFFPGYSCLAALVSRLTSFNTTVSLLIVSHGCFLSCIYLMQKYLIARFPDLTADKILLTLLAFAFSPMSFFFRMAYAESLFCLIILLVLYGIKRRWPFWVLVVIAGAGSAVRLVGLSLSCVLAMHLWDSRFSGNQRYWLKWLMLPMGAWGVLLFMSFLSTAFGDPWIFSSNHVFFNTNVRADSLLVRLGKLLILEPLWITYMPDSQLYWAKSGDQGDALFSLSFMNPIFFFATVAIVAYGSGARYLNRYECVLSVLLLAIPYISKGYDNAMLGHGRYASVVIPAYWVIGGLLQKMPSELQFIVVACGAVFMTLYATLFAAWHIII